MGHNVHWTRDLHFVCAPIYSIYIFLFLFTSDFSHKCLFVWWQRVKIYSLSLSHCPLYSLSIYLPWLIVIECSERLWFLSIFCILCVIYVFSVISSWVFLVVVLGAPQSTVLLLFSWMKGLQCSGWWRIALSSETPSPQSFNPVEHYSTGGTGLLLLHWWMPIQVVF